MNSTTTLALIVLAAVGATGLVVGLITWLLTRRALVNRIGDANVLEVGQKLIDVLATAGLVVDSSNSVIRSSASATTMGLIRNKSIAIPELVDVVDTVRRFGEPVFVELEIPSPGGGEGHWVETRAALAGNGNVVVLLEDKTESRRLDDARQDFLANISHELKTPIGAIGLLAEALVDATDDPETVRKFSKNLRKEARRLGNLVQDIIQLSRVQSKDVLGAAQPLDVSAIVHEAAERCAIIAESKDITVTVNPLPDAIVVGDPELLTVAVKNLIENAIKYSDDGKHVGVGVATSRNNVKISVADVGVGIPKDEQKRIFERFYRVDSSRSRQTGGTGLGLSLVKHIVFSHGGEITLFSQPRVGSTFTIVLPRFEPSQDGEIA
ncbi:MAG: hypothetical protein RLZZ587_914 [Actinomycetota bacterium]|jgi:two-component system sensor histidine kinase SenX3